MSNVKNIDFLKIFKLIKHYLMMAVFVLTRIQMYKILIHLAVIIAFYVAFRYWRKCRNRRKYLNNEWKKELNKARLEMRRALRRVMPN